MFLLEIKYLSTGKKYPVMVIQKHVYKRVKELRRGKVLWRCIMVHKGCKATCRVAENEMDLRDTHNHTPPQRRTKTGRWIFAK